MSMAEVLAEKLKQLAPLHCEIINESHMHAGPATESHFKLVLVSEAFIGLRLVARHQKIYALLAEELKGPIHALSMHLYSPEEWQTALVPDSPRCQGKHA